MLKHGTGGQWFGLIADVLSKLLEAGESKEGKGRKGRKEKK
jgi:hypothetical protein